MSSLRLALKQSLEESGGDSRSKKHKIRDRHDSDSESSDSEDEEPQPRRSREEPQPRRSREEPQPRRNQEIRTKRKRGRPPKKRPLPQQSHEQSSHNYHRHHQHESDGNDHSYSSSENEFSESADSYDEEISSRHRQESSSVKNLNTRSNDPYSDDEPNTAGNANSHSVVSSDATNDSDGEVGADVEPDSYAYEDAGLDEDVDVSIDVSKHSRPTKSNKKHHRAANKIQNQWKRTKHKNEHQGENHSLQEHKEQLLQPIAESVPKNFAQVDTTLEDTGHMKSKVMYEPGEGNDERENNGIDAETNSFTDTNSNAASLKNNNAQLHQHDPNPRNKKIKKSKQKNNSSSGKSRTVPAPFLEVLEWSRNLPVKRARKNVVAGLRVKVRFATKVRREGKILRKKKWFGGRVKAVSKEGSKIRIKYDDGTSEISKFPDKDVVVDDESNGNHDHQVNASRFIPPKPQPEPESESESEPEAEHEPNIGPVEEADELDGEEQYGSDVPNQRQKQNGDEDSDGENEEEDDDTKGSEIPSLHGSAKENSNNSNSSTNSNSEKVSSSHSRNSSSNSSNSNSNSGSSSTNNDDADSDNNISSTSIGSNSSSKKKKSKKKKKKKKKKIDVESRKVCDDFDSYEDGEDDFDEISSKSKNKHSPSNPIERESAHMNQAEIDPVKSDHNQIERKKDKSTPTHSTSMTVKQKLDPKLQSAQLQSSNPVCLSSLESKTAINKKGIELLEKEVFVEKDKIQEEETSENARPGEDYRNPHQAQKYLIDSSRELDSNEQDLIKSPAEKKKSPDATTKSLEDKRKSLEPARKSMEEKTISTEENNKPLQSEKITEKEKKPAEEKKKPAEIRRTYDKCSESKCTNDKYTESRRANESNKKSFKPTLTIRIPNVTKNDKEGTEQLSPLSKNDRTNIDYSSEDESSSERLSKLETRAAFCRPNDKTAKKRKRKCADELDSSDASESNSKRILILKKNLSDHVISKVVEPSRGKESKLLQGRSDFAESIVSIQRNGLTKSEEDRSSPKADKQHLADCGTDIDQLEKRSDTRGENLLQQAGDSSDALQKDKSEKGLSSSKRGPFEKRDASGNISSQAPKRVEQASANIASTLGTIAEEDSSLDMGRLSTPSPTRDGSASKSLSVVRSGRRAAKQANERIVSKQESAVQESVGKKRKRKDKDKFSEGRQRKDSEGDNVDDSESSADDDNNWVQCDRCGKWRILPKHVKVSSLPKLWYCENNIYDSKRNSCDAPEQSIMQIVKEKKRSKKRMKQRELNSALDLSACGTPSTKKDVTRVADVKECSLEQSPAPKLDLSRNIMEIARTSATSVDVELNQKSKRSLPNTQASAENPGDAERLTQKSEKKIFLSLTGKKKLNQDPLDTSTSLMGQTGGTEGKGKGRARSGKIRSLKDGKDSSKDPDSVASAGATSSHSHQQQQQPQQQRLLQLQQQKEKDKDRDKEKERKSKEKDKEKEKDKDRYKDKEKEKDMENDKDKEKDQDKDKSEADNLEWVQCEKCEKWRKLPSDVSADELPDVWYCSMNTWNPASASCDAPEDKADGLQDIGIFGNTPPTCTNSNKLSYRNLIFGSGKKMNRPISERTRAAESLFAAPVDESESGGNSYPTVMYSNSTAFVQRGTRATNNFAEENNNSISMFELMNHSNLWAQLRGDQLDSHLPVVDHCPRISYDTMLDSMKEAVHDLVCCSIGTKTIDSDAVIEQIKCYDNENMSQACLEARGHCDSNVVVSALCALVRKGVLEIVHNNTPDWTIKDWNPRYRLADALNSVTGSIATTERPPRFTRSMKIAKPWKQSRSQKRSQWIH